MEWPSSEYGYPMNMSGRMTTSIPLIELYGASTPIPFIFVGGNDYPMNMTPMNISGGDCHSHHISISAGNGLPMNISPMTISGGDDHFHSISISRGNALPMNIAPTNISAGDGHSHSISISGGNSHPMHVRGWSLPCH